MKANPYLKTSPTQALIHIYRLNLLKEKHNIHKLKSIIIITDIILLYTGNILSQISAYLQ